jgi:hypothetical protein
MVIWEDSEVRRVFSIVPFNLDSLALTIGVEDLKVVCLR